MELHVAMGPLWFAPIVLAFLTAVAATMVLALASGRRLFGAAAPEHGPRLPAFMGGIAIIVAFVAAAAVTGMRTDARDLAFMMALMFAVGFWSSVAHTREGVELAVQVIAVGLLARLGDVEVRTLGDIVGTGPIRMGPLALPATVVAMVAIAHSLTMMDDLEGFRATFAFTALAWVNAAIAAGGPEPLSHAALFLEAALAGYLLSTVLLRGRSPSRVFLGGAGGLMIGFALAWLLIGVTQGPGRGIPPIAALFFVLLPLADGASVALRQIERGENPLERTDMRIHHYLFSRGFTSAQALVILVAASALLGAVGYFGWRLGVPQPALFWLAVFGFLVYHAWIKEAWRRLRGVYFVI